MINDYSNWEKSVHQTAFAYLKYQEYFNSLEFLKKTSLYLESSSDTWMDGDRQLTGWHLYIQVPIEFRNEFDENMIDEIKEAYNEALGAEDYLRDFHLEIKKVKKSEFEFYFQDQIANYEKKYKFDVVLSFAGEDREYVENVANCLIYKDIRVFYDRFNTVDSWGKDLYTHFDDIYRKSAKYCVMFISKYYAEKLWTNQERRNAQARAFEDKEEYILPVKFDDTEIPGIAPTISYINANKVSPNELAEMIEKKIQS